MVDWDKQKKFQALAEHLKAALADHYGQELESYQGYNANRFDIHTKRPALPHIELQFSNEEHLGVSVGDGVYVPPFTSIANCSHCTVRQPDLGWDFDRAGISDIACKLIDIGIWIFEQHKAQK